MGMVPNGIQWAVGWFFKPRDPAARWWSTILWWEARRIPFNVIVGGVGIVSLAVFFAAILFAYVLGPGEDAAEPLARRIHKDLRPLARPDLVCERWA